MIRFYTWKTPNGRKVAIMLAETELPHVLHPVDIGAQQQFSKDFLAIAPNNKIPAIVDEDAVGGQLSLFESGAILTYLAEKSGRFLPSGDARWSVIQWLHWSVGGVGPMLGQLGYFAVRADERVPPAIDRFRAEGIRLLGVLERRLSCSAYLGGSGYSIADIATYPWIAEARAAMGEPLGETFDASPAINDWLARLAERPPVKKGMVLLQDA